MRPFETQVPFDSATDARVSSTTPPDIDAPLIIAALAAPLVCVTSDLNVVLVNDACAALFAMADDRQVGLGLERAFPALANEKALTTIRATQRDGAARSYETRVGGDEPRRYAVQVSRTENGSIVLLLQALSGDLASSPSHDELARELDALRRLAREMAIDTDSRGLLQTLCEVATEACDVDGAAVTQIDGENALVVAGAGSGVLDVGSRYALAGSLTGRAISERELVSESDYASRSAAMPMATGRGPIGEMLLVPLLVAEQPIGVLLTWRARGAPSFSGAERDRLVMIANHASVVLYKSRLLEAAETASLAKSNFLATISHELRTPVAALTGYEELLADDIVGPLVPEVRDVVERMRSVTRHLGLMIDDLLVYSSLESGRELVRLKDVRCAEIVRGVASEVEPIAIRKGLTLDVEIREGIPVLFTDPDKLRQILVNLIGNAVKFTDNGHVRIVVSSQTDGIVEIAVNDTGIGIAPEQRGRLFQPFSQLDSGLTRRHGGTGLGLHNAARLAALLGGEIVLESELGRGASFIVKLPVRKSGSGEQGRGIGGR